MTLLRQPIFVKLCCSRLNLAHVKTTPGGSMTSRTNRPARGTHPARRATHTATTRPFAASACDGRALSESARLFSQAPQTHASRAVRSHKRDAAESERRHATSLTGRAPINHLGGISADVESERRLGSYVLASIRSALPPPKPAWLGLRDSPPRNRAVVLLHAKCAPPHAKCAPCGKPRGRGGGRVERQVEGRVKRQVEGQVDTLRGGRDGSRLATRQVWA